MEVFEAILKRRSIRKFKKEKIQREKIERLKEVLIWAPSAGNLQARDFYFVFNEEIKKRLAKAALNQNFIASAPLVVVGCCNLERISFYGERGRKIYTICDVSAAIENLMLQAVSEGMGSCWIGAFNEKEVSRILNLPGTQIPIALIPVGFPAENPLPPPRLPVEEIIKEIE